MYRNSNSGRNQQRALVQLGQMLYNERVSGIGHATKRKATQGA